MRRLIALILISALPLAAIAEVKLPALFSDHMVVQCNTNAHFWGWADPGEDVSITASWGAKARAKADAHGQWNALLRTPAAGGPYEIAVAGKNSLTIHDVESGEVWFCSGQSNMEMSVKNSNTDGKSTDIPQVRMFTVTRTMIPKPADDIKGKWEVSSPGTVDHFSAAAFYFGRKLNQQLGIPVGLIHSGWGGTPVEMWTSREALDQIRSRIDPKRIESRTSQLFNGMVKPAVPYDLRGALWYQGEANVGYPEGYTILFPTMIGDWRTRWAEGDFPFYYVEIAPFSGYNSGEKAARLREAQASALQLKYTGMVVTTDITGDVNDIHPKDKIDVGERLALWALAKTYGKHGFAYSGPLYKGMRVEGSRVLIFFDHTDGGLTARNGNDLTEFTIAGADHVFHPAKATVENNHVVVWSTDVSKPVAVRFGWSDAAVPNLFNRAGLPAGPFRTDNWK